jgi:hypothetical protein
VKARRALAIGLAALATTCKPAAAPTPPPTPPPAEPPKEAPPPPKCDALEEGCVAKADERAGIAQTSWTIGIPAGWKFAHEAAGTIALAKGAAFATEARAITDKKKPPRDAALASAVQRIAVELPKPKGKPAPWPTKPDKTLTVKSLSLALFQVEGAAREAKHGSLLLFATTLPEGQVLVGAGFVADDDADNADAAILKSIESLESAPKAAGGASGP